MEKPEQIKARELYQQSGGKMLLIDIARQLGVKEGTLRSWKNRYKWDGDTATLQTRATQRRRKALTNKKAAESIVQNDELSEREKQFIACFIYAPNASQAAMQTGRYKTYAAARAEASDMMQKPAVRKEIDRLKAIKLSMMLAGNDDLIDFLKRAIYTDISAVVNFSNGGFKLKGKAEIDTSVISEVSKSKGGGLKVKRIDPLRAAELLCRIQGDFAPEKHRIDGEVNVTSPRDEINSRIAGIAARIGTESNTQ